METSIGPVEPEAPEARIAHEEEENENELRPGKLRHLVIFFFFFFILPLNLEINSLSHIRIIRTGEINVRRTSRRNSFPNTVHNLCC